MDKIISESVDVWGNITRLVLDSSGEMFEEIEYIEGGTSIRNIDPDERAFY